MLLVNHNESKIRERDALVKQRMRTNDCIRIFITGNQWEKTFLLTRRSAQRHAHAERLEPAPQDCIMLVSQNLRWRHKRGLIPRFDRKQHRRDGDDRFARAHVPLEQTVHRMTRRKIASDFRDYFRLRASQLEW
jgi:hypothetical protein